MQIRKTKIFYCETLILITLTGFGNIPTKQNKYADIKYFTNFKCINKIKKLLYFCSSKVTLKKGYLCP